LTIIADHHPPKSTISVGLMGLKSDFQERRLGANALPLLLANGAVA